MAGFARLRTHVGSTPIPEYIDEAGMSALPVGPGALGGFAGLRELVSARNMAQTAHIARQNALMEALLARFRSALGTISRPGAIAEQGAAGQLTRPWPGIYKGPIEAGRTVPKSYRNPRVFDLTEFE